MWNKVFEIFINIEGNVVWKTAVLVVVMVTVLVIEARRVK